LLLIERIEEIKYKEKWDVDQRFKELLESVATQPQVVAEGMFAKRHEKGSGLEL
jgi:hypothetical protein